MRPRAILLAVSFAVPALLARWSVGGEQPAPAPVVRLTHDGGFKQHLQWSPDGKRFLITRLQVSKTDPMSLWTMNADGSDLKPLLTPSPNTPHFDGHWSPDGKKVVF